MSNKDGAPEPTVILPRKKHGKHYAFLVAVHRKRVRPRVYAVMALSANEAAARIAADALGAVQVEVVGRLSRDLARRFKLKPGDVQPI